MGLYWKRWLQGIKRAAIRKAQPFQRKPLVRYRPGIETLEDRTAPAILAVNGVLDSTTSDSLLTLREAILLVNNSGDASAALGRNLTVAEQAEISGAFGSSDMIQFDASLNGQTVALTSGELLVSKDLAINGPGASNLMVSGEFRSRVFEVASGATMSIDSLRVSEGLSAQGGGILNNGTLTVTNCTIDFNIAGEAIDNFDGIGGGICNSGTLTLDTSIVEANTALFGGGIAAGGNANISNSTFHDNVARLGSSAFGSGGGIFNGNVFNLDAFGQGVNITNCTFNQNDAGNEGGAICNSGTMNIASSTLSGNSAFKGGGIFCPLGFPAVPVTLSNSIVALNTSTSPGGGPDIDGVISNDLGHNLIGKILGGLGFVISDLVNVDPLLAPLGDYGGATKTLPLLPGSPAIDAGDNTNVPSVDQRGFVRTVNGTIDIGAFESRGFTTTIGGGNNQQTAINSSFSSPLAVAVSSAFGEPVTGGAITFTAPGNGASAIFPAGNTVRLGNSGQRSVAVTANSSGGNYTVSAAVRGASAVTFNLTNLGPAIFTVLNTADSGPGSLRQAMLDANATPNFGGGVPDEIHFDIAPLSIGGMVGSYRAEGNADDSIGGNNGTLQNGATFAPGRHGQALNLDGASGFVNVPFASTLDLQNAITLDAWINPSQYSTTITVIAGRPLGYQLDMLPSGRIRFAFPSGSSQVDHQVDSSSVVPLNAFTHVAVTYDVATGQADVYLNGVLDNSATVSGPINSMNRPFQIGGFSDPAFVGGFFHGLIDEVGLFNRALTAAEVQTIVAGTRTISPTSALPAITDPVLIDGYTQPGASPNTLAVGDNAVFQIEISGALYPIARAMFQLMGAGGSTVKGLVMNRLTGTPFIIGQFQGDRSNGNTVAGNFIGTDVAGAAYLPGRFDFFFFDAIDVVNGTGNKIGGTAPADRNVIVGGSTLVSLTDAGQIVQGNYLGINAAGTAALQPADSFTNGIDVGGFEGTGGGNLIGGTEPGAGNVIVSTRNLDNPDLGSGTGILLGSANNLVQGNFIGTNAAGTSGLDGGFGIVVGDAADNRIVGNLISGDEIGISRFALNGPLPVIKGNKIGTDINGTAPIPNLGSGIELDAQGSAAGGGVIGGPNPGDGNTIAFNGGDGVTITDSFAAYSILGNSIFSNSGLGIANGRHTFPVLTSVTSSGGNTTIQGTLDTGGETYRIEFFANDAADPSGFGEGQMFLGFANVTTDSTGNFTTMLPIALGAHQAVSATATDPSGDTSEFSADFNTFIVDTLLDTVDVNPGDGLALDASGHTSLRAAIMEANATPGNDTIILPAGTYNLTITGAGENAAATGDLDITGRVTIVGAGAATTIIDAQGIDRVFDIIGVNPVAISGVTIQHGNAGDDFTGGGGIRLTSGGATTAYTLTLTDCIITANTAVNGGGINNDDTENNSLALIRTTVSNNTATTDGAGIAHGPNGTGSLTLTDCVVSDNAAGRENGGILAAAALPSNLTITGSTISGNSAPGGVGGGIEWFGDTFVLANSTVSGNSAGSDGGGIILAGGNSVTLTNCTISGNLADGNGGGLANFGGSAPCVLINVTITNNTADNDNNGSGNGGGIFNNSGTVSLLNTIVGGNTDRGGQAPDFSGPITSQGHNLIESTAGCTITGDSTGNIIGQEPRLGALGDNGGRTQTHLPLAGSPVIDAGTITGAPATDQRGLSRPQGAGVDIGAVDVVAAPSTVDLAVSQTDSADPVTAGSNFTYQITVTNNGPATATGVRLVDTLPDGVNVISSDRVFNQTGNALSFALDDLPSSASIQIGIVVRRTLFGDILNAATVSANETDPNTANNRASILTKIVAGAATHFGILDPQTRLPGVAFGMTVTAADQFDNRVLDYVGTVHFTSSDPSASLPSDVNFTAADVGTHFFSGVTLRTIGTQTITATDINNPTLTGSAATLVAPQAPTTFVVTNTHDSGPGSLRQAILDANNSDTIDTIAFHIGSGPHTIFVGDGGGGALPTILGRVTIDGTTQPGFAGKPVIEVTGARLTGGTFSGFTIINGFTTVKGLAINRFSGTAIQLQGGGNEILGNFIGTDLGGTVAQGNGGAGVEIVSGFNNIVGLAVPGDRNVISGNNIGVLLDEAAGNTRVLTNLIGTDFTGKHALGNRVGVEVHSTTATVGGLGVAGRNVISGNHEQGVLLFAAATVVGNLIGTDVIGTHALGNAIGIDIRANGATIGGTALGARNVISGNTSIGVDISANSAIVQGNFIGPDVLGTYALGNGSGIHITGGRNNLIGGNVLGARNVISGNAAVGITIDGEAAAFNHVFGNFIGPDVTGARTLGNQQTGVVINGASANIIGGFNEVQASGAVKQTSGNVISGNLTCGISIFGASATDNFVQGNFVGVDAIGKAILANHDGVEIGQGAAFNIIGGTGAFSRNIISGNTHAGVSIDDGSNDNVVEGNYIGVNPAGAAPLPNRNGIEIAGDGNTVGGTTNGAGNVISGNTIGVLIDSQGTDNSIQGNLVGVNRTGAAALANASAGIVVQGDGNTIGGTQNGASNVISGNNGPGISLQFALDNLVQGNLIGTDPTGKTALSNTVGINISFGRNNTIGGTTSAARNIISGNRENGILIGSNGNHVLGNYIGTDVTGNGPLGNGNLTDGGNGIKILGSTGTNNTLLFGPTGNDNIIGGTTLESGNVISGNATDGVLISNGNNNQVLGNLIGISERGNRALPNGGIIGAAPPSQAPRPRGASASTGSSGVSIGSGVEIVNGTGNLIGGAGFGSRNVISGNNIDGVLISGGSDNQVQGNLIGTDDSGGLILGNGQSGVEIGNSHANLIGGTVAPVRNILSGNPIGLKLTDGAQDNLVQGNYIGTDISGTTAVPGRGSAPVGVSLVGLARNNTIGGAVPGAGNVISGNSALGGKNGFGILIDGASGTLVQGNLIGTDFSGAHALPNFIGVQFTTVAGNNLIGGSVPGAGNVISGNTSVGIEIDAARAALIQGNFIGTDISGSKAVANGSFGIHLIAGADSNTIGGTVKGAGNVISGSRSVGIQVDGASNTQVQGNFIGTDVGGVFALPNGGGVVLNKASGTLIGGSAPGATNVISGNALDGILISGSAPLLSGLRLPPPNQVEGNLIGMDATGSFALPNTGQGVKLVAGASENEIGGTDARAGNVISGNAIAGVFIDGVGTIANVVLGNFIGTDASGTFAVGNGTTGVFITNGASSNSIGGAGVGARNVISGNGTHGVGIAAAGTTNNRIVGNFIGTDASGSFAIPNNADGVIISASNNIVGGAADGAGNVISGNAAIGVFITGSGVMGNQLLGNLIGTDASGTYAVGNGGFGVSIANGTSATTVGGPTAGARNIISGNQNIGLVLGGTTGNQILGNFIGTDVSGAYTIANTRDGINIGGASNNTIGGTAVGAGNVISGNGGNGVVINGTSTSGNKLLGNFIGTDASGAFAIANVQQGLVIANGASTNTVGGTAAGARNIISGNTNVGVIIDAAGAGNKVLGNFIGTDVSGTFAVGNGFHGLVINLSRTTTVGGTTAAARNIISGNGGDGVLINGAGAIDNTILGNFIGTDVSGAVALGNAGNGISIKSRSRFNHIGGTTAGAGNTIAFNGGDGIFVEDGDANRISRNSIFANVLLGIRLNTNDANHGQSPPHLTSAVIPVASGSITIQWSVTGALNKTFTIEFFVNAADDPQGKKYLGSVTVTIQTNNAGIGRTIGTQNFTVSLLVAGVSTGDLITATATDPDGNTSGFSNGQVVTLSR